MKIYIENISLAKLQKKIVEKYFSRKSKQQLIYTVEGIFKIDKNTLFKLKINDKAVEKYCINGMTVFVDKSNYYINDEYYQLPFNNHIEEITEEIYKLNNSSDLQLVFSIKDNFISDMYFYTKCDIDTIGIKKDIISFLSLLKIKDHM